MIRAALGAEIEKEENNNPRARGQWRRFNNGSVEVEVGEFLYSLTRLLKPRYAVETGTYYGVSAAYIGLAMHANQMGGFITLETNPDLCEFAVGIIEQLGLIARVGVVNRNSMTFTTEREIDLLFLDSEPDLRFTEFDRFYSQVAPGGVILIHDLHWHLGLTWYKNPDNGMLHWPYGDFREHEIGRRILSHELQVFTPFTPRGLVMLQKAHPEFVHPAYLSGTLEEKEPWP